MLPWEATQWCYCKPSINLYNTSTSTFYVILTWVVVWTYWLPFEHLCTPSRVLILTLNMSPVSANHIVLLCYTLWKVSHVYFQFYLRVAS